MNKIKIADDKIPSRYVKSRLLFNVYNVKPTTIAVVMKNACTTRDKS